MELQWAIIPGHYYLRDNIHSRIKLRHVWDSNKGVHGKKTNKKGLKIYQTEQETMDGAKVCKQQ